MEREEIRLHSVRLAVQVLGGVTGNSGELVDCAAAIERYIASGKPADPITSFTVGGQRFSISQS